MALQACVFFAKTSTPLVLAFRIALCSLLWLWWRQRGLLGTLEAQLRVAGFRYGALCAAI